MAFIYRYEDGYTLHIGGQRMNKLNEPTLKEFKQAINNIPSGYDDATIRVLSNRSCVTGLELDIGPEWVIWIHTYGDDE